MSAVLRTGHGVSMADWPGQTPANMTSLGPVMPWLEQGMEREAWELLGTDERRLATFRTVHGNRPGRRPRPSRPTLFDLEEVA